MNQSSKLKPDLKKAEAKNSQRKLIKFYVLPVFSVLSFVLIIVLLILPKVSEIFVTLDNISLLSEEYNKDLANEVSLTQLSSNSNLLLAQLEVIDQTAPTGETQVVSFRNKMTTLIQGNNLSIVTQSLSESDINKNASNINTTGLALFEIPFNFEINGRYDDMLKFIDELSKIEDFIIVREMQLSSSLTNGIQTSKLLLRVDKYQFNIINKELLESQYLLVPIESQISQVALNYIESRL